MENRQTIVKEAPITNLRNPQAIGFTIDPVAGCKSIDPKVIVFDQRQTREIVFPNLTSESVAGVAEAIRRSRAPVELRGIDRREQAHCGVNVAWASAPR